MIKIAYIIVGLMLLCGVALSENNTATQNQPNQDSSLLNYIPGYHLTAWTFQDIWHIALAVIVIIGVILALVLLTGILKWVGYIVIVYFVLSFISTLIS